MVNDYERWDFWNRETAQIEKIEKKERSMKNLIESNRLFDEKNRKGFEYDPNDREEDMSNNNIITYINQFFI